MPQTSFTATAGETDQGSKHKREKKDEEKNPQDKLNTNKNLSIRADISVTILSVNDSMLQPKDLHCLNEDKNKTSIYAVCKRPMSDLGTH